jgi:uncharacterized protein
MWLKLILLGVVAVIVYRAFGGRVPLLDSDKKPTAEPDSDTLIECATCGTYVTVKESIVVAKKHYCSKECIPD